MSTHLTPVDLAVKLFGGVRALARAVGRDPAAVSRWKKSGCIPSSVQLHLLRVAKSQGLDLTAHDIIFGREID
jgi:hypothetical protein